MTAYVLEDNLDEAIEKFDDVSHWDHPLIQHRVPVTHTSHPRWKYHVVLSKDEIWSHDQNVETTDKENRQLIAFLDFRLKKWYRESYIEEMRKKYPFDVDSGVNTVIFRKSWLHGWGYRQMTWTQGYPWFPHWDKPETHYRNLVDLLDKIENLVPEKWETFKLQDKELWRKY